MSDPDYLWDGAGTPPPDIAALEQALAPLRYTLPLDELRLARQAWHRRPLVVGAAITIIAVAAALWLTLRPPPQPLDRPGLAFTVSDGTATYDGASTQGGSVTAGGWLQTQTGNATLELPNIGNLSLAPGSKLTLQRLHRDEQRVQLAFGRLTAQVIAPPRMFVVETPRATVVDLGCAYVIDIDATGTGSIDVTSGYVELATSESDPTAMMTLKVEMIRGSS